MKRRPNKSRQFWVCAIGSVMAVGLGLWSQSAGAEELKARLSYHWAPAHHSAIYSSKFADEVNKELAGKLHVDVFPSGQLFGIREVIGALSSGAVDMGGVVDIVSFPPLNSSYNVTAFPNLFSSFEQMHDFFEKDPVGHKLWTDILNKAGIVNLAYVPVGPSVIFSTKSDLSTVEKMAGLKTRALTNSDRPTWLAYKDTVISLPTGEVYTALQTGMIDTMSTVPSAIKAYDWWAYLKYVQLPPLTFSDASIMANAKWFNGLPKDVQAKLLEIGARISKEATDSIMSSSDETLKEFAASHGGHITVLKGAVLDEFHKVQQEKIYPELAKSVDPAVFAAAKKFVGMK